MTDVSDTVQTFTRYVELIRPLLAKGTGLVAVEPAATVSIERGILFARAVGGEMPEGLEAAERLIELAAPTSLQLSQIAVLDREGNHRALYRPLLVYAWLQAYRIWYETLPREQFGRWDEALRAWSDLLEAELESVGAGDGGIPATYGAAVAEVAWTALALHVAGKVFVRDAWTDLAADTFGQLSRAQQPGGAFLVASGAEHPELTWYHELAILHASASYAVQAEDRTVARAVARGADYVSREIQPDHATAQPWGLFAFLWNAPTRPLADALLHQVEMKGDAVDGVSLILLADALYSLRLFGS